MTATELTTRQEGGQTRLTATPHHLTHLTIPELLSLSKVLVGTGFLPAAIKTPEQAAAVMLKGQELAVPPMAALSSIAIITGKPVASAELMAALIYRDHGDDALIVTRTDAEACTVSYRRRGWRERRSFTFSAADAAAAGLLEKTTWKQYRPAMLRARAYSAVARLAFPDTIGGMYTPEELGAAVEVDPETGEIGCVGDATPRPVAPLPGSRSVAARSGEARPASAPPPVPPPAARSTAADGEGEAAPVQRAPARDEGPPATPPSAAGAGGTDPWQRYTQAWDAITASGYEPRAPRELGPDTPEEEVTRLAAAGEAWLAKHAAKIAAPAGEAN